MILNLKNKKVFILGGSGTIGSKVTESFLKNSSTVFNLDLKNKKFINKKYTYIKFDCTKSFKIESELGKIFKKHGAPDVFINTSYPINSSWNKSNFSKIKFENFTENLNLQLVSYSWISKLVADQMKRKKIKGSIILMSSIYSIVAQDRNLYKNTNLKENFTYPIIKGGINQLVKQMASYYGKQSIRVNSISLGGIKGQIKGQKKSQDINFQRKYIAKTFLNRMCTPNDVAGSTLFLASNLSEYITGTNLIVDGGYTSN